jgi:hypothetical protein
MKFDNFDSIQRFTSIIRAQIIWLNIGDVIVLIEVDQL